MPSKSATARIAASETHPSCSSWTRHRIAIAADAWRPGGYFAICAFAQARVSGANVKLAGCCFFGARRRTDMSFSLSLHAARGRWSGQTGWAAAQSPVDLAEHDIERAENGRNVSQQVALADEIHRLQMRKAGRADLAFVGLVGAVGDQIHAELALRRLDRGVDFAGRHMEALGVKLEMMDQCLHRALHLAPARREDLVVLDGDGSLPVGGTQLRDALLHDARGLAHFFHPDQVAVVTIAVLADRNVEIHLGVAFVRLRLAQIPRRTRAANHHAGKTPFPGLLERDYADVDVALLEDAVAGEQPVEIGDHT